MADDTTERFINPYTDFGFKKLFGTEMNKDLLISFLNALFNGSKKEIEDVQYLNGENLGDGYGDRRSIFDVYCMSKDGSRFIVEMQKAEQTYFKDRSVYYATTPIRQQAPKGKWDYHLEEVYTVGILNFEFPNNEYPAESYRHEIQKLFDQAEIAKYSDAERRQYEASQKEYWDYTSTLETAERKGALKEKTETVQRMKSKGFSVEDISEIAGLTIEEVKKLL